MGEMMKKILITGKWVILFTLLAGSAVMADDNVFQTGLRSYLKGDVSKSVAIWEDLARNGDLKSQKQLGHIYYERDDLKDYDKSLYWYQKAIDQGDQDARNKMQRVKEEHDAWQSIANRYGRQVAAETIHLRANLHEGVMTNCGMVIEARSKIAYIQTHSLARWYLKDELYVPGVKQCDVSI